jgi:hypothetical protein
VSVELVYREDWKAIPAARPLTQEHVAHPDLTLALYGPGADQIKKSHHEEIKGDPYYIWSGRCDGAWAISLRHNRALIDLSGGGVVRWRARQSGRRRLRLILKPEARMWMVSDQCDDASADWREFEVEISAATWRWLDIDAVTAGREAGGIELARVDAVGVTDLMPGGGSGDCSRLDWIEVWGRPVARRTP